MELTIMLVLVFCGIYYVVQERRELRRKIKAHNDHVEWMFEQSRIRSRLIDEHWPELDRLIRTDFPTYQMAIRGICEHQLWIFDFPFQEIAN